MFKNYILIYIILLFKLYLQVINGKCGECFRNTHERCLYEQDYTREELNIAVKWIIDKFAETDPVREPCNKVYIRKEVKCMTNKELKQFADAYKELINRGVLKSLVKIHDTYWSATHKFNEGINWHIWLNIQFQKELFKINPNVVFPYWDFHLESTRPEKSRIWKYFGHSGNKDNDFAVTDGLFANLTLYYPNKHILRREWNEDGTISSWESPEWATTILQSTRYQSNLVIPEAKILVEYSKKGTVFKSFKDIIGGFLSINFQVYALFAIQLSYSAHFKTHLHLGGWHGDLSTAIAPNDPIFWSFHEYGIYGQYKWQLSSRHNLVPRSYDLGVTLDWNTKNISLSNLERDHLTYFNNITLKETFQLLYGEMCYIPEQFIRPINDIVNNKVKIPTAVSRLRNSLPKHIFARWFPKFALNPEGFTYFDHFFPEIGDCNLPNESGVCKTLPVAKRFQSTQNGKRQYKRFVEDDHFDLTGLLNPIEENYYDFMKDLKTFNYCSPYVY